MKREQLPFSFAGIITYYLPEGDRSNWFQSFDMRLMMSGFG
jgi:hypothetical protein